VVLAAEALADVGEGIFFAGANHVAIRVVRCSGRARAGDHQPRGAFGDAESAGWGAERIAVTVTRPVSVKLGNGCGNETRYVYRLRCLASIDYRLTLNETGIVAVAEQRAVKTKRAS